MVQEKNSIFTIDKELYLEMIRETLQDQSLLLVRLVVLAVNWNREIFQSSLDNILDYISKN